RLFGCIAGAVGGAIAGAFNAVSWSYNMPGIATIPAFFKSGFMTPFIGFLISIVVSFVLAMVLTMIFGFKDEASDELDEVENKSTDELVLNGTESVLIGNIANGHVVAISEVNDEVFASCAMGKGVGIKCIDGKVFAPSDAKIVTIFPTKHAIGLETTDGVEILIHIGINTVNLGGEGFNVHIKDGQDVKAGELLVEFDSEQIKASGYDDTIMVVVTNTPKFNAINVTAQGETNTNENILEIIK
ncbi:MAG: PTS sugar transporter subunit IIA, partial [Turicibacter sp.]